MNQGIIRKIIIGIIIVTVIISFSVVFYKIVYRGSLSIDAQIIYNLGGPQPVARQNFYLLDTDPFLLNAEDKIIKERLKLLTEKEKGNYATAGVFLMMLKHAVENPQKADKSNKALLESVELSKVYWEPHLVQFAKTDFKGHAVFEKIRPGTYWLMGITETRANFTFWNLKVEVGFGENKLMLDQNNALYSK